MFALHPDQVCATLIKAVSNIKTENNGLQNLFKLHLIVNTLQGQDI